MKRMFGVTNRILFKRIRVTSCMCVCVCTLRCVVDGDCVRYNDTDNTVEMLLATFPEYEAPLA